MDYTSIYLTGMFVTFIIVIIFGKADDNAESLAMVLVAMLWPLAVGLIIGAILFAIAMAIFSPDAGDEEP